MDDIYITDRIIDFENKINTSIDELLGYKITKYDFKDNLHSEVLTLVKDIARFYGGVNL